MQRGDLVVGREYAIRESQWHEADRAVLIENTGRYHADRFGVHEGQGSNRKRLLFAVIRLDYDGIIAHPHDILWSAVNGDHSPYVLRYVSVAGHSVNRPWQQHVEEVEAAREERLRDLAEARGALEAYNLKLQRRAQKLGVTVRIPSVATVTPGQAAPKATLDTSDLEHLLDLAEGRTS